MDLSGFVPWQPCSGSMRKLMNYLNQFGYCIEMKVKSLACCLANDPTAKSQPTGRNRCYTDDSACLNNAKKFFVVCAAVSSKLVACSVARHSATYFTNAGSLVLPRYGIGAR